MALRALIEHVLNTIPPTAQKEISDRITDADLEWLEWRRDDVIPAVTAEKIGELRSRRRTSARISSIYFQELTHPRAAVENGMALA